MSVKFNNIHEKFKCACCEVERPGVTATGTDNGDICLHCLVEMYYDGLDRKAEPLSFEETKRLRMKRLV